MILYFISLPLHNHIPFLRFILKITVYKTIHQELVYHHYISKLNIIQNSLTGLFRGKGFRIL